MKFLVTLTPDPEDGGYVVECPAIPGCISQGDTREEALANIQDAMRGLLDLYAEEGWPLTVEVHQVDLASDRAA